MSIVNRNGRWAPDNITTICKGLRLGYQGGIPDWSFKPKKRKERSKIIRRGKTLANGDILWMEGGRLYIETKGN